MDARPFHFKHFSLFHHRSTMKVGTDAVLLGRWVEVCPEDVCLDIGTGCGILPLMLAQKGVARFDAVDLDADSVAEAGENFAASQWRDRLQVYQSDIRAFEPNRSYDLIVSNPPFFINSFKSERKRKNLARHTDDSLSFEELCKTAKRLLKPEGRFALVLPYAGADDFIAIAERHGLYLHKQMDIIPVEGKEPNRVNLEMRLVPKTSPEKECFIIRGLDDRLTEQYHLFLKDYYLG